MNEQVKSSILLAEKKWKQLLEKEVEVLFTNVWLPSHDLSHHKRVWHFTKELLLLVETKDYDFIEASMIAAYMHDTGLSLSLKPEHGEISSRLAEKFLEKYPLRNTALNKELLLAITRHDDKSYSSLNANHISHGLYEILTIADDLDALGALGLYRYFEIYALRNIPANKLIEAIEKNIRQRFDFIASNLKPFGGILEKHATRLNTAITCLYELKPDEVDLLVENSISKKSIADILPKASEKKSGLYSFLLEVLNEENQTATTFLG